MDPSDIDLVERAASAPAALLAALRRFGHHLRAHEVTTPAGYAFETIPFTGHETLPPEPRARFLQLEAAARLFFEDVASSTTNPAAVDSRYNSNKAWILYAPLGAPEFAIVKDLHNNRLRVSGRTPGGFACGSVPQEYVQRPDSYILQLSKPRIPDPPPQQILSTARTLLKESARILESNIALLSHQVSEESLDSRQARNALLQYSEARADAVSHLTILAGALPETEAFDALAISLAQAANHLDGAQQLASGILRDILTDAADFSRAERRSAAAGMLTSALRLEKIVINGS